MTKAVDYPGRTSCACPFLNNPDPQAHWKECGYRLNAGNETAPAPAPAPAVSDIVVADRCASCDGLTLGLSGESKWCCYCGSKLDGDSVEVEVRGQPGGAAAKGDPIKAKLFNALVLLYKHEGTTVDTGIGPMEPDELQQARALAVAAIEAANQECEP